MKNYYPSYVCGVALLTALHTGTIKDYVIKLIMYNLMFLFGTLLFRLTPTNT